MTIKRRMALTDNQMAVYLECANNTGALQYNITFEYVFESDTDPKRLKEALEKVFRNYAIFSTGIIVTDALPELVQMDECATVGLHDLSEDEYSRTKAGYAKPFTFDGSLLCRADVYRTEKAVYLLIDIHHLVYDGVSTNIFEHALGKAFLGEPLQKEEVSVFDYAESENVDHTASYAYFEQLLGGVETDSNLVPDIALGDTEHCKMLHYDINLDYDRFHEFAGAHGLTDNMVLLAAFTYALAKYTGQSEALFSSVNSGRRGKPLDNTLGFFVRTFPLYFKVDEDGPVADFLESVKTRYIETMSHDDASFSELARRFGIRSDIKYVFQNVLINDFDFAGQHVKKNLLECDDALSNMNVMLMRHATGFTLRIDYKNGLYSEEQILRFAGMFECIIRGIPTAQSLKDIKLTNAEDEAFLAEVNNTDWAYDRNETVWDILAKTIANNGNKPAVCFKDRVITYTELDSLTARLAAFLKGKGIGREDYVSVLIPRNEYMAVTSLGIVRAGAAYQPLDPTYPAERLNFMVKDCGAKLLIADRALRDVLSEYTGDVLFTDEIDALPDSNAFLSASAASESNTPVRVSEDTPESAIVIIYTSGTTGTPKGCVVENRNIVCLYYNHIRNCDLDASSRVASYASFGFDAAILDIFTPLLSGATLYVIPDEIRLDIRAIDKMYCDNGITHGFITTQVGRMFAEMTSCKTLRTLLVGGEKLTPFNPPKNFAFINGYGPSESVAYVCCHRVTDASPLQPIGKPSKNTRLYVTDKYLRLLPQGAVGELCVAGGQVGRGYLNRPDVTAKAFVKNPFSDEPEYDRIYRTGDVVRFLPSGEIDFIGRMDAQVKIRGFRIELTEVEQIIREYEPVKDVTVLAPEAPSGGRYLVAYVVSDEKVDFVKLKAFVADRKPEYMVPETIVQLPAIPLTPNGKVDKRKLPVPELTEEEIVKPSNDVQQRIFDKVAEVIGSENFGISTNLFSAGLSSIGMIKLNVLLADEFGVDLTVRDLRKNNTVELLEELMYRLNGNVDDIADEEYPLTKTQQGLYVEWLTNPEATNYNIPILLKLDDAIDCKRLKQAIADAVNAHRYLLTTMHTKEDGSVCQTPGKKAFSVNEVEDITGDDIEEIKQTLLLPYELTNERLFRIRLIHANGLYIFFDIHHIICDGTSASILLDDISKCYLGEKINEETFTGFDVVMAEQKLEGSRDLALAKDYYSELLSDADCDFLPESDLYPDSVKDSGRFEVYSTEATADAVKDFCTRTHLGVNAMMLSAFGFTLAKYNAEDYSVFTSVYNGREDSRTQHTFAMLVKTLPVRVNIDDCAPRDLIENVADQFLDSMANDIYSFAEISREFGVKNDIMFIFQGDSFGFETFCGLPSKHCDVTANDIKSPLSLQVYARNNRFIYRSDYDKNRYSEEYIRNIILAFDMALQQFTTCEKLSEVSLVSPAVRQKMAEFNNTDTPIDETRTMAGWFEETAGKYPDHIAVSCEGRKYTYSAIEKLSARVASYLVGKGIGKNDFVPILVDRNEFMVICTEGVIRAGAAYEPLDPAYPIERLRFMIEDADAKLIIADRKYTKILKEIKTEILYTDEIRKLPKVSDFKTSAQADDPFVIIYTSGTTGQPKGNVLAHRNPVSLFSFHIKHAELGPDSNTAYYTGFSFDAGMLDFHASLLSGGTLFIIPESLRLDLPMMDKFFCDNAITHTCMTTQMGSMFSQTTTCKTFSYINAGGEKLVPFVPPKGLRYVNGYGPCECTIYTSGYEVYNAEKLQPIGKPHDNIKYYILDKYGNRLPIGAAGELCIAGRQVGLGYHKNPEKTAKVFTTNPFDNMPGYTRLYHTGDVVRELPDGNYDFIGRKDNQIKIRGFRVELSEIEQVIRQFAGVENATVQAFDEAAGGKYIAAYVASSEKIDFDALEDFIAESKPSYMIPSAFMQLPSIPLTANGKVDKRALPIPGKKEQSSSRGREAIDDTEDAFCEIFCKVLGLKKVYADDDFFAIGGSSITAAQAVVRCNAAGYEIVFKNFFDNPTPEKLANFVRGRVTKDILAPAGDEKEKYDYSCLEYNVVDNLKNIRQEPLGDILLTGVTGFLGAHVFKVLIEETDAKIVCLVRHKGSQDAESRFKSTMKYYFRNWYNSERAARTTIIDTDLTDKDLAAKLDGIHFDTIINNAANVKHFSEGNSLVHDNFESVENLLALAEDRKAKLVQASSLSVCGESVNGSIPIDFKFKENNLNIGQSLENKYVYSKYLAEQAIIDAISRGKIRGKIIRLGNLAARESDGEFQINPSNSGLMKMLQGYLKLGCYPVDAMDAQIEFSPIDKVAEAMLLLASTPDEFTVFHAKNCNTIHYGYIIQSLIDMGHKIDIVERDEFEERFKRALDEEDDISAFTGFIAYLNRTDESVTDAMVYNDDESNSEEKVKEKTYETRIKVSSDTAFTVKALYRLGFAWPITGSDYLNNMVGALDKKEFFD